MTSRSELIASFRNVADCTCDGQHLIDNLRDLIVDASDEGTSGYEIDDRGCVWCQWVVDMLAWC